MGRLFPGAKLWFLLLIVLSGSASHAGKLPVTQSAEYQFFLQRTVTKEDILILQRADEILSDETKWDPTDNRRCDPNATSWSLSCALHKASVAVTGRYRHRRVAIDEVRFSAEELGSLDSTKRPYAIMEFNKLPSTRFTDIKGVLKLSLDRLSARLP